MFMDFDAYVLAYLPGLRKGNTEPSISLLPAAFYQNEPAIS